MSTDHPIRFAGRALSALVACTLLTLAPLGCGDDAASDPCAEVTCSGHGTCSEASDGQAVCACAQGYAAAGLACNNVDECAGNSDDCAADATCSDTEGSFTCACNPGFSGNGKTCAPDDPCADNDCHADATCAPSGDSFTCTCKPGFSGDGTSCAPDDPCADNDCHADATCTPVDDGYTCECNAGFSGDGATCTPDDPCSDNACDPNATCTPVDDGYTCECNAGFSGDGETCTADDACSDNACDANATCTPVDDGYTCECNAGFSGDGETCTADEAGCDPDAETNDCDYACLPLEAGGGMCVGLCQSDDDCAEGLKCNADFAPEGEAGLCLPNASCEALTFFGECDGTTLRYCGFEGPVEVDCSEDTDAMGQPLACRLASPDVGYDCVAASFTGGCGEVTYEGSCSGDVLTYCESQASGNVVTFDCASEGLVCSDASGSADCVESGATGCGAVTANGTCEGTTATWCENFEVVSRDCAASSEVCGNVGDTIRCVAATATGGASTVTGKFTFEKKALSASGLGAISKKPVRAALVTVRKVSDDSKLSEGFTAQDGSFTLQFEASEEVYVLVTAQGAVGKHNHIVRDCPLEDCGGLGNVYGAKSANFTPSAASNVGETVITVASGTAGAFNIFDVFVRGADFANTNMGRYPPTVNVQWKAGSGTAGGTSYFTGSRGGIFILGSPSDTDEYDDPVLLHEYGHYLEFHLSRSDSPGGPHDGSPTDPRLAWGEGYGTYVGCAIADTPIYIDSSAAAASATDIRTAGNRYLAELRDPRGMKQLLSEYLISQILWTIAKGPGGANGKGHAPTFDVLSKYFKSFTSPEQGRGVSGVELVDYLDGWFCKQHGDRPYIEGIINNTAKFPYDYSGPATCN